MKRTIHTLILTAASLALATAISCTREGMPSEGSDSISFSAENASYATGTRAETGTDELTSLSSFLVTAATGTPGAETGTAWQNTTFTGPGTYTASVRWPMNDPGYTFYASNETLSHDAGGCYIETASVSSDIVCAYLPKEQVSYKAKNTLSFEHILARLGSVTVEAEQGFTITNVALHITPRVSGRYDLRTGTGKTDGTGWSSTGLGTQQLIASATGTNDNDLWLLPGTYQVRADWTATQAGGATRSYSGKTVNIEVQAGSVNYFSALLGGEITFGILLEPFNTTDSEMDFKVKASSSQGRFYYQGGSKDIVLSGFSGDWSVDYSTDGGSSWTSSEPSGLTVTKTAANNGRQTYSITLTQATAESSFSFNGTWPADEKNNTPKGNESSPLDLSITDIHGDITGTRETANTYVVSAPGTYMIPLVYGNAITDGKENPGCYITGNTQSGVVKNMYNAYGTGISSPYIDTDAEANGHSVASAALAWCEIPGMINVNPDIRTQNGMKYLVFTVNPASIGYGNAVVSVKNEEGTTLWSWLIWVTASDLYDETVEARTSPATREVSFLSDAIGTVPPTGSGNTYASFGCTVRFSTPAGQKLYYTINRDRARVYSTITGNTTTPWYQFGRNVPQPRSNINGYEVSDGTQVSMADAIQHPGRFFIRTESPYNWCSDNGSQFYNVWNMNQTAADQNVSIIKSVYDPSPAGYVVPRRNDFTYFTTDGSNHDSSGYAYYNVIDRNDDGSITNADFTRGWFMKRHESDTQGLYFPAAGYRGYASGSIYNVGSIGYYWSSSPYSASYARGLDFYSGYLYPLNNYYRAYGFSVRPVRQD